MSEPNLGNLLLQCTMAGYTVSFGPHHYYNSVMIITISDKHTKMSVAIPSEELRLSIDGESNYVALHIIPMLDEMERFNAI